MGEKSIESRPIQSPAVLYLHMICAASGLVPCLIPRSASAPTNESYDFDFFFSRDKIPARKIGENIEKVCLFPFVHLAWAQQRSNTLST